MRERLEKRLTELKKEYESGQKMLVDLETRQANVRSTLLRISGAVQVLEEALAHESRPEEAEAGAVRSEDGTNVTA